MFFALSIFSALGYAFQNVLLAKYARKIDIFALSIIRNLSLGVTMFPVFFFLDRGEFGEFLNLKIWLLIFLASFFGLISLIFLFKAYHSLPVGIVHVISKLRIIFLVIIAYIFLNEKLSALNLANIFLILAGVLFLSFQNYNFPALDGKIKKGITLAVLQAFFLSLAFFFMSIASRKADPLVVGYFWEVLIGVMALIVARFRTQNVGNHFFPKVAAKDFWAIFLISTLTIVGTGFFALAVEIGPIAVASAIGACSVIVVSLISHFLHHEKLSWPQWAAIFLIVGNVVMLV